MRQIVLKGNYHEEIVRVRISVARTTKSNTILVCVHGLYGEAGDARSKSVRLGTALQNAVRGVVYITTSRDWSLYGKTNDRAEAFSEKTFAEEQKDVRDAIDMVLESSEELFGVNSRDVKLWVVGNSMGGSLISMIVSAYPAIKKIALCGSGIMPSSPDLPILSTYPSVEDVRTSASAFAGEVLHIRGGLDTVVGAQSQEALYASFTSAKFKKSVVIEGANHNFSSLFGKSKDMAYRLYVDNIVDFMLQ